MMEQQELLYRETKLMEPILRMQKVLEPIDEITATTLVSVAVQYITEHYRDAVLTTADVQKLLRAILLREEDGVYYATYLRNELQVKVAGWLLLLAADLPITMEQMGMISENFGKRLADMRCVTLQPEEVLQLLSRETADLDAVLSERILLNRDHYMMELRQLLG